MELASVIDVGVHFVKATYHLEGDLTIQVWWRLVLLCSPVTHELKLIPLNMLFIIFPLSHAQSQVWIGGYIVL